MHRRDCESDLLVKAVFEGDHSALEQLLRRTDPALRASLNVSQTWQRYLELDDILQVTYTEAFLRITTLRDVTQDGFRSWTQRIAQNSITDAIRELTREKRPDPARRVTRGGGGESARTLLQAVAQGGKRTTEIVQARESLAALERAVDALPESYRDVVRQVDLAERSVADVAQELRTTAGAIHMRRARAHDRLRDLLGPNCDFRSHSA